MEDAQADSDDLSIVATLSADQLWRIIVASESLTSDSAPSSQEQSVQLLDGLDL